VKEAGSNSEKDDLLILQRFLTKMFGRKKCARQQAVLDSLSSYPFSLSLSLSLFLHGSNARDRRFLPAATMHHVFLPAVTKSWQQFVRVLSRNEEQESLFGNGVPGSHF
jgi:hypothetical protein